MASVFRNALHLGAVITLTLAPGETRAQSAEERKKNAPAEQQTNGHIVLDTIVIEGAQTTPGTNEIKIKSEDLQRKNPTDLKGVFAGEPAIAVGSSIPASQKVYVNGIEETNLSVTIDGSSQNNKVFHHNGTNLIDPSLLKAVTVEAGVAPADVGPGALGGSIAYETKDAADLLLPGKTFGGMATSSWNFNSNTFIGGIAGYGIQDGFEYLGYVTYGKGDEFEGGNGQDIPGTETNILSGIGKLAYEFASGDRIEISHERVHDDTLRPFRANTSIPVRPWEPEVRNYRIDRNNTVFTYTDTTPEGWWDPKVVLAYSNSEVETPVFTRVESYPVIGETRSFNGKAENKFALDMGSITAGVDFYNNKAALDAREDTSHERASNVGLYAQARLEPWERTRLSFGARGDHQWFTGTEGSDWSNSGLSGNVSGEYDLVPEFLTAKAGFSHVWAGIPLAENFIMNPNWNYGDGPEPTTADNYTAGLEATWNGFTLGVTVFQTNLNDTRSPRYAAARAIDAYDVKSEGYEISAGYNWDTGFVNVKYVDIDVEIDGKPADSDTGTYLATPVGQIISIGAGHSFTDWGLTVGGNVEFTLDYDKVAPELEPLDGYTVANAYAEYRPVSRPNFSLRADVLNLFDEEYASRATYGQEFANVTPLLEPGRTFKLTATARF